MVNIQRLVIGLLIFVVLLVFKEAHAEDYPAKAGYALEVSPTQAGGDPKNIAAVKCGSTTAANYTYTGQVGWDTAGSATFPGPAPQTQADATYQFYCERIYFNGVKEWASTSNIRRGWFCDGGGTLGGSNPVMCVGAPSCPPGQTRNPTTGVCETPPPPPCASGNVVSSGLFNLGSDPANLPQSARSTCYAGCVANFFGSYPVGRALVKGKYRYFGNGYMETTGSPCTAGDAQGAPGAKELPPSTCDAGQVLGQFNGKDICLNGGTGEPINPNTPPVPTTDTTTTSTTNNPDGSTTKTEITTRPDGSQTIVTTTTQPNGSTTQSKEEKPPADEDPKKSFCEENPDAELCKKSDFGGGCGGFNCKGDAIQCAIAQEQHRRNCTMFDTSTALSDLGNQFANGNDPQASAHPANAANRSVINVAGSINTSKQYSGTCPADRSVSVMGQTIAIPLSTLCPYLEMFGSMMIALAMLGAARTVGVF